MTTDPWVLLKSVNDTVRSYPAEESIHSLFAEQAAVAPERVAVVTTRESLTYRQLDEHSARLTGLIAARGVRAGDLVAVRAAPGIGWVVANLAVLRAGAAYLPINPVEPGKRVEALLDDSGAALVLREDSAEFSVPSLDIHGAEGQPTDPPAAVAATSPAYVMYTSGSTGTPKGVLVSHRNVVRLVRGTDFVNFSPRMRVLQTGAVSFDATTFELWGPLLNGGTLVLPDTDAVLDVDRLAAHLRRFGITTMWLTSPLFSRLAQRDPAVFALLEELVVGGDVVVGEHVAAVQRACPDLKIVNGYGPTENTTFSTTHLIAPEDIAGPVPIGRPIANSTAYVLDEELRPVPPDETGELYVGGDGVAIGYLNRPELTAAVFLDDPFSPGSRMYRTGDRARWRPDGVIEFLGRTDGQVKVRGYRIEPSEIEAVLRGYGDVGDTVVVVRERDNDVPGDRYLVAYVTPVPGRVLDAAVVRVHLAERLPAHLVPGYIVEVDALPLTAHGKVDRGGLPDPQDLFDLPAEYVPPRDDVEQRLVDIWKDVLRVPVVGVLDSLFDLGVDSLTAALLAQRTRDAFRCDISTQDLLSHPAIEDVAELVVRAPHAVVSLITPRVEGTGRYPLTPQQRPLFVEQSKDHTSLRYNVPVLVEIDADVDVARLQAAWHSLVDRHDALRTEFLLVNEPVQRVRDRVDCAVELREDVPELTCLVRPFDLGEAPLARVGLHRADGQCWLFADIHHLIVDGMSLATLFRELDALYRGGELPPVEYQYSDYAEWTATEGVAVREAQLEYWRRTLAHPVPTHDLPTDRPRPQSRTYEADVVGVHFGQERTSALRALAAANGVTLFVPVFAAYSAFLSGITGSDDVVVGVPSAGRTVAGVEATVGMFVNTVCVRVRPEGTFRDFVREVARTAQEAFAHQDMPLGELVRVLGLAREPGRHPVFHTMFALHGATLLDVEFLGRRIALRPSFTGQAMFDLNLQVYEEPDDLRAEWEYSTELFDRATAEFFRDLLLGVVDRVLAEPDVALPDLIGAAPTRSAVVPDLDFNL